MWARSEFLAILKTLVVIVDVDSLGLITKAPVGLLDELAIRKRRAKPEEAFIAVMVATVDNDVNKEVCRYC
jgi:hypothetical protein